MKYYIEYPIPIECGLRCPYCFHTPLWEYNTRYPDDRQGDKCAFTLAQFKAWRDKHLTDASEFLVEMQGGEMSHPHCQQVVLDIVDNMGGNTKFQLQTNGLGEDFFYMELAKRKDKIDRIGLTYHRVMMNGDRDRRFDQSLLLLKALGIKVYVKEMLHLSRKNEILENKNRWESRGIEFRIQDFKGNGGLNCEEKYTAEDWALVHPEYRHGDNTCYCREGYKQIIVRGYDQHGGDVLACWQDHKVIGNIVEDWYNPYDCVNIDVAAPRCRKVIGDGVYRGDYQYDLKLNELEKEYHKRYPKESKMLAKAKAEVGRLTDMLRYTEARALKIQGALEILTELIAGTEAESKEPEPKPEPSTLSTAEKGILSMAVKEALDSVDDPIGQVN